MAEFDSDRSVLGSIEREFTRYESLGLGVINQLAGDQFSTRMGDSSNSVAQLVWHISGNLKSRFTDFLESDGEKPWRNRETEFDVRAPSAAELLECWQAGWDTLHEALVQLNDQDLDRAVVVRGKTLTVLAALLRSLAHLSYHVGQMVYVGKQLQGPKWNYLSIAPGQSDAYYRGPTRE